MPLLYWMQIPRRRLRWFSEDFAASVMGRLLCGLLCGRFQEDDRGDVSVPFLFQTVIGSMMAAKALSDSSHDTWAHDMASLLWPTLAAR